MQKKVFNLFFFFMLVGEAGHVSSGAARDALLHLFPRLHDPLRDMVLLRADQARRRRDADQRAGMVDQAGFRRHRLHVRPLFDVRPLQGVRPAVPQVEGLQQHHLRAKCPRERKCGATAAGCECFSFSEIVLKVRIMDVLSNGLSI